ncbi:hypothetical protein BBJ28_00006558 [Nothophytophthora sp. Chile5]|nr:hypothetical protein BBJ28_00006558 [Nothophytophthora sp. Chile5]
MSRLTALDDVLLARIVRFLAAREVEALTVAAKVVATHVMPRFPDIWRALFCQRWATLNFPLRGVEAGDATLAVDPRLHALFPRLNVLLECWMRFVCRIQSLHDAGTRPSHVVNFAFNGEDLGDDRSVRANAPFPAMFHLSVFKRRSLGYVRKPQFHIGLVASGYFEIQIVQRDAPTRVRPAQVATAETQRDEDDQQEQEQQAEEEELTSLGLVPASFPLVGRQPGWNQRSYGYHGDDGRVYRQTTRGRHFGPRFGTKDTVGCGVRRDMQTAESRVFFTSNGEILTREGESEIECPHASWYPAVGVDSYNEVRVNFGQEPFAHDGIVDELFAECDADLVDIATALPWHDIREYSIGCLVWRHRQACQARAAARADADAKTKVAAAAEVALEEETGVKKWIGLLTRRQQNRLASSEENASEERAAARRLM